MNEWMFLFSLFGIIGAVLIALKKVQPGYVFWVISDIGMIMTIVLYDYAIEQLLMWLMYTVISIIGLLNWRK
jgi:hypothetical protein